MNRQTEALISQSTDSLLYYLGIRIRTSLGVLSVTSLSPHS